MFVAQRELGVGGESDAVGVDVTGGRASVGHLNVRGYVDVVHLWFPEARCCFWSRLGSRQECILDETRFWTGPGSGGGWILREAEFGKRLDSGRGWILEETGLEESGFWTRLVWKRLDLHRDSTSWRRLALDERPSDARIASFTHHDESTPSTLRKSTPGTPRQVSSQDIMTSQLPAHHTKPTPHMNTSSTQDRPTRSIPR